MGKNIRNTKNRRRYGRSPGSPSEKLDADETLECHHDLRSNNNKLFASYVVETTEHDNAMVKDWNDALDVLIIMAGLFSAVLTGFVVQTYPLLQEDPQQTTNRLLVILVQRIDAFQTTNGNDTTSVTSLQSSPPFTPSFSWWLVNMLWFSSLMCSLVAAFFAMLAKQWLQAYTLDRPGRLETHAHQRQFRYAGLLAWKVPEILSTLPVLLQFGFLLFFAGLVILTWSINQSIGYVMMVCTILLSGFYITTTLAPLGDVSCPFKTPFSLTLRMQVRRIYYSISALIEYAGMLLAAIRFRTSLPHFQQSQLPVSNADMENAKLEHLNEDLNVGIIEWLVETSHKPEVVDLALKSISSLRPNFNATRRFRDSGAIQLLADRLNPEMGCHDNEGEVSRATALKLHAVNNINYLASMFNALRFCTHSDIATKQDQFHWRAWIVLWKDLTIKQLASPPDGWDIDVLALYLCASSQCSRAEGRMANREFSDMVELLNWHSSGEVSLDHYSVWALVDSIASWGSEFSEASMLTTRAGVISCLIRLLGLPYVMGDPISSAIGVAFGVFALDFRRKEMVTYRDEETRREKASSLLITGVMEIMKKHSHEDSLRDLDQEDYEAGGMVICKLLSENGTPDFWPEDVSAVLLAILSSRVSENLICRVLETFRRLLSFDSQSSIPMLSASIVPLLEPPASEAIQVQATQVIEEMRHWKAHRTRMLELDAIQPLVKNLSSTNDELSNASSFVLQGFGQDPENRDAMVAAGLADALYAFFSSRNAAPQCLVYWSWLFVKLPWSGEGAKRWSKSSALKFEKTLQALAHALEEAISCGDDDYLKSEMPTTPIRRRDLERNLQSLKRVAGEIGEST